MPINTVYQIPPLLIHSPYSWTQLNFPNEYYPDAEQTDNYFVIKI